MQGNRAEIVIIGGGLAGLTAAAYAGRAGQPAVVLERSSQAGGRGITNDLHGYKFNLGPHAVYRGGPGMKVLRELGIEPKGGVPPLRGYLLRHGNLETLSLPGLVTTDMLGIGGKLETAKALASVQWTKPESVRHVTVRDWLARVARREDVREFIEALVRVSTYGNDPDRMSAEIAVQQIKLAARSGVLYVDNGWQTLVDALRDAAERAGARIVTGARVEAIEAGGDVQTVRLGDGSSIEAAAVIAAVDPRTAAGLIDDTALRDFAEGAVPVRAACLDIAVDAVPRPRDRYALGIDQPLYFSIHSDVARLAPERGATFAIAKYLSPDETKDARELEAELEQFVDLVQPGWRDAVVDRRFLPNMTVVNAIATAQDGGLAGRPAVDALAAQGLFLAGDWVGDSGWLSDGSLASAKHAAQLAIESAERRKAPEQAATASA